MREKTRIAIVSHIIFEILFLIIIFFTSLNFGHGFGDLGMGAMLLLTIIIGIILLNLRNIIDNKALENLIIIVIVLLIIYSLLSVSIWKGPEG